MGRFEQARDVLEVSLAEEPDNLETLNLLGGAYESTGQGELSIRTFQRALELDPTYASVLANYGTALLRLGREDDAIRALVQLNRNEEAIRVLTDFIERAPANRYAQDIERMRQVLQRIQQ